MSDPTWPPPVVQGHNELMLIGGRPEGWVPGPDETYVYVLWEAGDPTFLGAYTTSQAAGEAAVRHNRGVVIWSKRDAFGGEMTWQQENGYGNLFITELRVE